MVYGYQIWWEEPLAKLLYTDGIKDHAGVNLGAKCSEMLLDNKIW